MADGAKDSMFLSETDSGNNKDHSTETQFRTGYALYRYESKRTTPERDGTKHPSISSTETEISSHGHKDISSMVHVSSLAPMVSSLGSEDEAALNKFLNRKLVKQSIGTGSGHISAIDLSLGDTEPALYLCYYRLLCQEGSSPSAAITADDLATLGLDDLDLPPIESPSQHTPDEFIMCLIAPAESQLDLFKADLDQFSANILAKLDSETTDVVTIVKPLLDTWFESTTDFLRNCSQRLGNDIKYLIHAALTGDSVNISGTDQTLTRDLRRFVECCSLSDLLSNSSNAGTPGSTRDLLVDFSETPPTSNPHEVKVTARVKVEDGKVNFETKECSKFCEDWAHALEICDYDNVSLLRQVIESYKLKAIQDMNTLKRLLKQAETDHYSLYRCLMFLKQCGNGSVLVQYAEQELAHSEQPDTTHVLNVLQDYIRQSGGLVR